ncbi:interleukin-6 receptor subunit alpha-like [Sinocyclocheilus rhinocerous]|uniref:interleukin-6 receptor subunit alpha-like n=1 Tax=Sinocyclocheilus rhinocerous TaxID=307959 RepID=UPI0007BA7411|nr:PREDICTED: interleukin-6 receptor subunit alpha-like [Sinocyclocheilus rhinocerous]
MWTRFTLKFLLGVLAAIEVHLAPEELCPRQEPLPGVLVLKLGSNVVFGCRGDITVDGVPLASASVMNKKYRTKQREDITVSWTSQKGYANATQLTSMKGNATTGTYQKTDSAMYTKAKGDTTVTVKPPVTIRKEQTTSRRVLRAVTQTTGQEEEVFGITMGTDFEQDDYEDYDYEEERSRVTRGIKKRTRWTLNGRQVHAGVERGGILRRPHLSWADAGNYSCYRGERLISTVRISIGVNQILEYTAPASRVEQFSDLIRLLVVDQNGWRRLDLGSLILLTLSRTTSGFQQRDMKLFGNVTRVPCSFSRSRCWCVFHVEEGDRVLHAAKLCVSNTAGSAMSPYLSFKLHDIIKPDPPTRVVVRAVEGQKHMLKVSWSYPSSWKHGFYALHFQLRYRPQLKEQYQSVLIDDRTDRQVSWTIYDALPHIQYEVQLQAKDDFDGLWSDWTDTVYAVTWTAPETTTTSESITLEPLEMFPEGSGGSGEDPCVGSVAVDGADDIEYATVWLYVSCVFGLCFLVVFTMLTVCLHRNRLHFMSRIGKQTLPFAFFLHSPRPLPAPVHSEQLPEEGKSLMSPPKHSQQDFLPVQQEGIHLHNMDYFLSPGTEGVPWTIDRHD